MQHPDSLQYIPQKGNGYVYHLQLGDKHYIGISTTPFSVRWFRHKSPQSHCKKLVREISLYKQAGKWNEIKAQIIKQAKNSSLDRLQKIYIKKFASYNTLKGLNSTPGGRDITPATLYRKKKSKTYKNIFKYRLKKNLTWQDV